MTKWLLMLVPIVSRWYALVWASLSLAARARSKLRLWPYAASCWASVMPPAAELGPPLRSNARSSCSTCWTLERASALVVIALEPVLALAREGDGCLAPFPGATVPPVSYSGVRPAPTRATSGVTWGLGDDPVTLVPTVEAEGA